MKKKEFASAEQYAMHDIAQYNIDRAEIVKLEPLEQRYRERGYPGYLDSISQIIGTLFVSCKMLKNKRNRQFNQELGIHKINKNGKIE
tara:strand:+ start:782 stop:1045 length:264 start_codon:yes stop_codon:yes gene_type:complete